MSWWGRRRSDRDLARQVARTFDPADVATYYDEWDQRYEAVFGDVYQHLQAVDRTELFDHMSEVAQLDKATRVLDAGCGIAGPAMEFARRCDAAFVALTISPRQGERAGERLAEVGLDERVTVEVGDFHRLDQLFQPGEFDLVYFLESLVHAQDPEAVLSAAFDVLSPGGVLYIKDFYRGRSDDPAEQRVIDECVAATNEICQLTIRNTDDMLRWVEAAGFEIEVSQPLAVSAYSIEAGHEFCARYDLDVAAGRDFRTTFYLDNLEIRARRPG